MRLFLIWSKLKKEVTAGIYGYGYDERFMVNSCFSS